MAREQRYFVLFYPGRTVRSIDGGVDVQKVMASSEPHAANVAKVPPGGYALVVAMSAMRRFNRAEQAPLEEVEISGNPLPQVGPAS